MHWPLVKSTLGDRISGGVSDDAVPGKQPIMHKVLSAGAFIQKPHLVWNCDETGISMEHTHERVVARQGTINIPGRTSNSLEIDLCTQAVWLYMYMGTYPNYI